MTEFSPNPPANIVRKGKASSVQFAHYPGAVPATSDFNRAINLGAYGDFLNGASNPGDQSSYDYVDVRNSLKSGAASKMEIWLESTVGTEIWILINPMVIFPMPALIDAELIAFREKGYNSGWRSDRIHRIWCPPGEEVVYKIEDTAITGFNIDYNGAFTGAGTPEVDALIINLS